MQTDFSAYRASRVTIPCKYVHEGMDGFEWKFFFVIFGWNQLFFCSKLWWEDMMHIYHWCKSKLIPNHYQISWSFDIKSLGFLHHLLNFLHSKRCQSHWQIQCFFYVKIFASKNIKFDSSVGHQNCSMLLETLK